MTDQVLNYNLFINNGLWDGLLDEIKNKQEIFYNIGKNECPLIIQVLNIVYYIENPYLNDLFQSEFFPNANNLPNSKFWSNYVEFLNDLRVEDPNKVFKLFYDEFQLELDQNLWVKETFIYYLLEYNKLGDYRELLKENLKVKELEFQNKWWNWLARIFMIEKRIQYRKYNEIVDSFEKLKEDVLKHNFRLFDARLLLIEANNKTLKITVDYYNKGLAIAKQLKNYRLIKNTYNRLGILYTSLGKYQVALEYFLNLLEFDYSKQGIALTNTLIGYVYFKQGDIKKSFQYYSSALVIVEDLDFICEASGFAYMGICFYFITQGQVEKGINYFKTSKKAFSRLNKKNAIVYATGNIAQLLYEQGRKKKALKYFEKFSNKLKALKAYPEVFSNYCFYLITLLDNNKIEIVENELEFIKTVIAEFNDNNIIKIWFLYVHGYFEKVRNNLWQAKLIFEKILHFTIQEGPYDLFYLASINLSEIYLSNYTLTYKDEYFTQLEVILSDALIISSKYPIYPMIIYLHLYYALIHVRKSNWDEIEKILRFVNEEIEKIEVNTWINDVKILITRIESMKYFSGNYSFQFLQLLKMGTKKSKFEDEEINEENLGIIAWKLSEKGPEPFLKDIPKTLFSESQISYIIPVLGPLFMSLIGQGHQYHQGIFGPLPVPISEDPNECIISTKLINDKLQKDPRLKGQNFILIGVFFPRKYKINNNEYQAVFETWYKFFNDLSEINEENIKKLKSSIILMHN